MQNWLSTKIELNPDKEEISRYFYRNFTFDDSNRIMDETIYDKKGNIENRRLYRYYPSGELKEFIEYDPKDELIERQNHFESENGDIYQIVHEYQGGFKQIKSFSDLDFGRGYKCVTTNEDDEIVSTQIFIMNDLDQVTKVKLMDENNNEYTRYERLYNSEGQMQTESFFLEGQHETTEVFKYNLKGLNIERNLVNHIHDYNVIESTVYDDHDQVIEVDCIQNGAVVFYNRCEYNEEGILVEEEYFELNYWERRITRHERLVHEMKNS